MCRGRLLVISDFDLDLASGETSRPVDERSNERVSARSFANDPSEKYFIITSTSNRAATYIGIYVLWLK